MTRSILDLQWDGNPGNGASVCAGSWGHRVVVVQSASGARAGWQTPCAVVVSPASYNGKVGLALLCPITGQVKGYPFEVSLPAGLEIRGVVLSDQIKSLDWRARKAEFVCKLPRPVTGEVLESVREV